jgi:hypothetical protein
MIAAVFVLAFYIPAVQAQAKLVFSGGNGSPLTITLQQSVTYTINNSQCSVRAPFFNFDEAGNAFGSREVTGTMTFSINGGPAQHITETGSGFSDNDVSENDIYVYGNRTTVSSGSTIVLNAGTITTIENFLDPLPANGSYATFIVNYLGNRCSENGVAMGTTAASVSISGRVLTSNRRGLSSALVYLTDSEGNTRTARTSSFGYYRFNDISAGQSVTVTVVSKRYQFALQVVNVNEEMSGLNFLAEQ